MVCIRIAEVLVTSKSFWTPRQSTEKCLGKGIKSYILTTSAASATWSMLEFESLLLGFLKMGSGVERIGELFVLEIWVQYWWGKYFTKGCLLFLPSPVWSRIFNIPHNEFMISSISSPWTYKAFFSILLFLWFFTRVRGKFVTKIKQNKKSRTMF